MRDVSKRLLRLEELIGDLRCICERTASGNRFACSTSELETAEAQRRFDACPARHADAAVVVFIKTYGTGSGGRTGTALREFA